MKQASALMLALLLAIIAVTVRAAEEEEVETSSKTPLTGLEAMINDNVCAKVCEIFKDPSDACKAACVADEEYTPPAEGQVTEEEFCREFCSWLDPGKQECQADCLKEMAGQA